MSAKAGLETKTPVVIPINVVIAKPFRGPAEAAPMPRGDGGWRVKIWDFHDLFEFCYFISNFSAYYWKELLFQLPSNICKRRPRNQNTCSYPNQSRDRKPLQKTRRSRSDTHEAKKTS